MPEQECVWQEILEQQRERPGQQRGKNHAPLASLITDESSGGVEVKDDEETSNDSITWLNFHCQKVTMR